MIKLPEKVSVSIDGQKVSVQGPKGKLERNFPIKGMKIESKDGSVAVMAPSLMLTNTVESHIRNMCTGVTEGYAKKMQVLYSHFPITVEIKGKDILIKNFQGEKRPRRAKIAGATKVEIKGQDVFISGLDKEDVGQTVANLTTAVKIKKRDSRVFQDGMYLVIE
jgi:large subunit ribosomal protein L6